MSEDEDMEEEESQDPAQGVDLQNGRENSNSIPVDEMCGSTPIRVNHESVQNQIPMTISRLNEMIDRRLHVIKTDLLFTRKAQLSRLIQRKKLVRKQNQRKCSKNKAERSKMYFDDSPELLNQILEINTAADAPVRSCHIGCRMEVRSVSSDVRFASFRGEVLLDSGCSIYF